MAEIENELRQHELALVAKTLADYPNLRITDEGEYFTVDFPVLDIRCNCPECNKLKIHQVEPARLSAIQTFRTELDRPIYAKEFYRCRKHPKELKKDKVGEHTRGAIDVPVKGGEQRMETLIVAIACGATGIGIANTFIHVDFRDTVKMAWKY
jgi:zinc D-Ala-D-Ala carboxypeptidase